MDLMTFPELLGSMTSDDGQVFCLHVKDVAGTEMMIGIPHREIAHLIEVAAVQVQEGSRLRGDKDLTAFNTRSFSVGVSEGGQVVLTLAIGATAKLAFVLPGDMTGQLSETLAIASARSAEAKSGGAVN